MIGKLAARIRAAATTRARLLVAIAGPPGSGKTTLAASLAAELGPEAVAVPMDGYHLDDSILIARGQRARKGAPHTFDVAGYLSLLRRIHSGEAEVFFPIFDRKLELSRNAAGVVTAGHRIILAEGNYLLLDQPLWRDLHPQFGLTIMLAPPMAELDRRLLVRWDTHGKSPAEARAWIDSNDMPNIRTVLELSRKPDIRIPDA